MHSTRYGRRRHLRRPICSRMMPVVFSNRDDWSFNKCTVAIRLIASAIPVLRSNCNFLVATRLGERTSTRGDRQMTISYHLTSVSCNRLRRKQCIRSIPLRGQNHPQIHASGGLGRGGRGRVASRAPNHTNHPNTHIGLQWQSASIWGHRLRSTPTRTGVITRSFVHESAWRHAIA